MKSKFCFIRNPQWPQAGDFIYQVWVGSSLREFAKLKLVEEYCKDVGFYFEKWCPDVDAKIDDAKRRFRVKSNPIAHPFNIASVTISQLFEMIIDDSLVKFESEHATTEATRWQMLHHTISYYQSQTKSPCNTTCSPCSRKYLSLRERSERLNAAISVLAIVALLYLDAFISYIFNWF